MDKKVVHNKVQNIVDTILTAHGKDVNNKDDQTMGRSLFYLALTKNEKQIVAATNPPEAEDAAS